MNIKLARILTAEVGAIWRYNGQPAVHADAVFRPPDRYRAVPRITMEAKTARARDCCGDFDGVAYPDADVWAQVEKIAASHGLRVYWDEIEKGYGDIVFRSFPPIK